MQLYCVIFLLWLSNKKLKHGPIQAFLRPSSAPVVFDIGAGTNQGKRFFFASEFARDTCLKIWSFRHLKHFCEWIFVYRK